MEQIYQLLFGNANEINNASILIKELKDLSIEDLFDIIFLNREKIQDITAKNIPQFSNINIINNVLNIINDSSEEVTRQYIGYILNKNASPLAQTKYGENHLKLAIQLGLASEKPCSVSAIGYEYMKLSDTDKVNIQAKLSLRIPIIQHILLNACDGVTNGMLLLSTVLSEKTAVRRRSNVKKLIAEIYSLSSAEFKIKVLNNIIWS